MNKVGYFLKNHLSSLVFIAVIGYMAVEFSYQESMFYRPQSIHAWRQTDCGTFALNYYRDGLNPLNPRMHNELGDGGKSLGEGPILYYAAAILYTVFGYHEWMFRALSFLIFALGLWFLYKFLIEYTKDKVWSIIIPALLFSFPLLVYYGNSFMPNVPSLGLVLMAWFYFYRFTKDISIKNSLISSILFLLAGWLKAPALTSYIALLGIGFLYMVFQNQSKQFIFKKTWPLLLPLIFNFGWYSFSSWYANYINSTYLSAKIFPYWKLSEEQIEATITNVTTHWYYLTVVPDVFKLILLMMAVCLPFFMVKSIRFLWLICYTTAIGFAIYTYIFFIAFHEHDYYLVNMTILAPMFMLLFVKAWEAQQIPKVFSWILKIGAVFLLLNAIKYAKEKQTFRYFGWVNDYMEAPKTLFDMESILEQWGISKDDKIISVPDISPNMSLYYLNRQGFSTFNYSFYTGFTTEEAIKRGAKFLVVSDTSEISKEYLKPFVGEKLGQHQTVAAYRLILPE